jgi:ParB family chromosome partitioning protein
MCLCENEDAAAREISLAENLIREAMTPADEARAYRDIVDGGADAEAVARRFGVTVRHVQGRLRLADLAEADLRRAGRRRDHARCRTGLWLDRRS